MENPVCTNDPNRQLLLYEVEQFSVNYYYILEEHYWIFYLLVMVFLCVFYYADFAKCMPDVCDNRSQITNPNLEVLPKNDLILSSKESQAFMGIDPTNTNSRSTCSTTTEDFTYKVIGDFGPWQLRISILMALLKFPLAWYQLGIVFLAPQQPFWCEKPESMTRYSNEEWRDICKPRNEEHPCLIYDPEMLDSMPTLDKRLIPLVNCNKFIYDKSNFNSTIISEWDLVCSNQWLVQLCQFVLMWGVLVGTVVFGLLADKYGRRKPLMVAIFMQSVTAFISCLAPWYTLFIVNRFVLALASGGVGIISFVICMEIVSGKYRTTIPIVYQIPFGFGNTIMAAVAYYMRDWRKLEFSLACLTSTYLAYYWYVPESPRWLLARGRKDEAIAILKSAAATNKREVDIPEDTMNLLANDVKSEPSQPGFITFMRYKSMRLKTILLSLNWFCTGMSFYAFSQFLGQIAENIFLTVALGGIISTPGSILCVFVVKRVGRKATIAGSQLFTALCFLLILAVPKDVFTNDWPRIFIAGLGLAGMAISIPALYLFSGELYPTLGRNVGVGGCSMFARVGSMAAPLLVSLERIENSLPLILLAVCAATQATLVWPLPETKGCSLPDTIEQADRFDKQFSINYRKEKKRRRKRQAQHNDLAVVK